MTADTAEWRCPDTGWLCTPEDCDRVCFQAPAEAQGDERGQFAAWQTKKGFSADWGWDAWRASAARFNVQPKGTEPRQDWEPIYADALTQAIQRLNSNLYNLTKDECIQVIRELRDELRGGRTNSGDETGGTVKRFGWDCSGGKPEIIPATNGAFVWYDDYLTLWQAHQATQSPAPAPSAARLTQDGKLHVTAWQCHGCGHRGIDDGDDAAEACSDCNWRGPCPDEDVCPGCGREGTMVSACPKCGDRYYIKAEADIVIPTAAQAPAVAHTLPHPKQIAGVGCALCGKNEAGYYCTGDCGEYQEAASHPPVKHREQP